MPLLAGLRQRFSRRNGSQPPDAEFGAGDLSAPNAELRTPGMNTIEPKPLRAEGSRAARPLPEEALITIKRIGAHMDAQSERAERLLRLFNRMPQAIEAVPELNRQTARLLEVMTEQLSQSRSREQAITSALGRIDTSCGQQTELAGLIHQELDAQRSQVSRVVEVVDRCQEAMADVAGSNGRSAALLERLVSATEARDDRLERVVRNGQRWALAVLIGCGALSAGALALAIVALAG